MASASILQELSQQLNPSAINVLSQQLGANPQATQSAISNILPMLVGGLSRNVSSSPQAAQALDNALANDHDGSLLEQFGGILGGLAGNNTNRAAPAASGGGLMDILGSLAAGNSRSANGAGILGHILGANQQNVANNVSRSSGLGAGQVQQLMMMLAPMLMASLGKQKRQNNLNAQDVSNMINNERASLERQMPSAPQGGLIGMLDVNNDGKVDAQDALAQAGKSLMGSLFGRG